MIDKAVIHLKNIIFFKAIIYITIFVVLSLLVPQFMDDLDAIENKKSKLEADLDIIRIKPGSTESFESKIKETHNKYWDLKNKAPHIHCSVINNFTNYLSLISEKHKLSEPIQIKVMRDLRLDKTSHNNGHIHINYYNIAITIHAETYDSLLNIIREVGEVIPKGALITNTKIIKPDALTPEIIEKLSTNKTPDFISAKMHIQLRKIVYEQ
ncbi:MAG: hypothetical protein P8P83_05525 [Rickettsiaceae bacterium]|nr:hypothetical protein [Rickettsiaceae bacterium]